jgi:hypothetical protein
MEFPAEKCPTTTALLLSPIEVHGVWAPPPHSRFSSKYQG